MAIGIKSFEFMWDDDVFYAVTVKDDKAVQIKRYCPPNFPIPLILNSTEALMEYFAYRSFDKRRPDLKELLHAMGLSYYQPYLMCRKMHGLVTSDTTWLRFEDEPSLTRAEAMRDIARFKI